MNAAQNMATRPATARGESGARPASEAVTAILAAHSDRTASELAQLAGLGLSTVTKALAALEKAGYAVRRTPEHSGDGRRPAALWRPVATAPAGEAALPTAPGHTAKTGSEPTSTPRQASAARGRLAKGELGTLVLEYLLARPGEECGPTGIGKALSRSQGAVANCLTKLATAGDIVQTRDKPRRYRLAS